MTAGAAHSSEATLLAVERTALDIVSVHNVSDVFDAAVARAQVLLRSDIAYLAVYEEVTGRTCVRASIGARTPDFNALNVPFGVGVGGVIARSRQPFLTCDYIVDQGLLHIDNVDRGIAEEGIRAMLGVPLIARGELTGVLFVSDRSPRAYSEAEVKDLQALGAVVTVAIENARLFEAREAVLHEVQGAYETLRRRTAATESIASLHEALAMIASRGRSLHDLAERLAAELGSAVGIAAADGARLAAAGAADAWPWAGDAAAAALAASTRTGRVVPLADAEDAEGAPWTAGDRLALALAVGDCRLGALFVASTRPLLGTARRSIERAGHVAALLLLRRENDLQNELRQREARFAHQTALDGAADGCCLALALDPAPYAPDALPRALVESGCIGEGSFAVRDGALVVLLPGAEPGSAAARAEAVAEALAGRLHAPPTIAWAVAAGPRAASATAEEAARWLRAALALGRAGEVVCRAHLGADALLLKGNSTADLAAYFDATLGELMRYDAARRTDLVATLRAYFAAGQNLRETAQAIEVHMKTVVQRLERIGQLLGEDWKSPRRLLQLQLAIRVGELTRTLL